MNPKFLLAERGDRKSSLESGRRNHGPFNRLNTEGTAVVQVTHSEKNSAYGKRVIQLRDGWIVNK